MGEMGGWAKKNILKNKIKNVRYGQSGARHMGEMGGWAKFKKNLEKLE